MTCSECGFPERRIWPPSSATPHFVDVGAENWMVLSQCPECGTFWAGVPYEPHASFMYYVVWQESEDTWREKIEENEGLLLHTWHKIQLKKFEKTLTNSDLRSIEAHRERSYGRDPYSEA